MNFNLNLNSKLKTILKRGTGFLSALVIAGSGVAADFMSVPTVSAEVKSASEMASSMIDYYRNRNAVLGDFTVEDIKSLGVFISNFYVPFETNVLDTGNYPTMVYDTLSTLKGETISEDDAVGSLICGELQAPFLNDVSNAVVYSDGTEVLVGDLFNAPKGSSYVYMSDEYGGCLSDQPVFYAGYSYSAATIYQKEWAFFISLLVSLKSGTECSSYKDADFCAHLVDIFKQPLYVSPYGDLISEDGTIIVPACLNPYVFSKNGDKLPVNNAFFMGNFSLGTGVSNLSDIFNYTPTLKSGTASGSKNVRIDFQSAEKNIYGSGDVSIVGFGRNDLSVGSSTVKSNAFYRFYLEPAKNLKAGGWFEFFSVFHKDYVELETYLEKWINPSASINIDINAADIYSDFASFTDKGALQWHTTDTSATEDIKIASLLDPKMPGNTIKSSPSYVLMEPIVEYYYSLCDIAETEPGVITVDNSKISSLSFKDFYEGFKKEAALYSSFTKVFDVYVKKGESYSTPQAVDLISDCASVIKKSSYTDNQKANLKKDLEIYYVYLFYNYFFKRAAYTNSFQLVADNPKAKNDVSKLLATSNFSNTIFLDTDIFRELIATTIHDVHGVTDGLSSIGNNDFSKDILNFNFKYFLGIDANNGSYSRHFYQIFAFPQDIARILAMHKASPNAVKTGMIYYANFYYAYISTLASYTDWYFPAFDLGSNAAAMLAELQQEEAGKLDSEKLLKSQWEALKTFHKLTSTGGSNNADAYQKKWFNNTLANMFLGLHEGIVGTDSVGYNIANTGTNNSGVITYGTIPRLNEMSLTAGFVKNYKYVYLVLMAIVLVSIFFMFLLQVQSLPKAILSLIAMSIALAVPLSLVDASIVITNKASSIAYTNKFKFWAIVQHQMNVQTGTAAAAVDEENSDSNSNTLTYSELVDATVKTTNYYSSSSVRLKWMSPKKVNTLNQIFGREEENSLKLSTNIFKWVFSGYFQQESYSADSLATYVYRPYSDLCTSALSMWEEGIQASTETTWKNLADFTNDGSSVLNRIGSGVATSGSDVTASDVEEYDATKVMPINYSSGNIDTSYMNIDNLRSIAYFSTALAKDSSVSSRNKEYSEYYKLWNKVSYMPNLVDDSATTKLFTSTEIFDAIYFSELTDGVNHDRVGYGSLSDGSGWTGDSLAFMLYSESPFYYFYNVFKNSYTDDFVSSSTPADSRIYGYESSEAFGLTGFSKMLISDDFFYADDNSKYAGLLKDFLDLEDLFCLVIPYLRSGNDYARSWIDLYGSNFDFYAAEGSLSKYHTENLEQIWALYSPWVDTLAESWAHPYKIRLGSKNYEIADSLNPYTYVYDHANEQLDRFMAFGEADIAAKGYTNNDLTTVEKHINAVLSNTYTDLRYLVNYSGFDNEVLVSMAAMLATFNFNSEFTKVGLNTPEMYPTGFELQNFSYDSYLRLILLNATGESFLSNAGTVSIYKTLMQSSGVLLGGFIVLLDILCAWVIPAFKFVFIIAIILFILAMTLVIFFAQEEISKLLKTMLSPLLKFVLVCLLHTYGTSVFMGDGLTDYVGSQSAVMVTNSASITLCVILALNLIVSVLYFKIILDLVKSLKKWGITAFHSFTSLPSEFGKRFRATGSDAAVGAFAGGYAGSYSSSADSYSGSTGVSSEGTYNSASNSNGVSNPGYTSSNTTSYSGNSSNSRGRSSGFYDDSDFYGNAGNSSSNTVVAPSSIGSSYTSTDEPYTLSLSKFDEPFKFDSGFTIDELCNSSSIYTYDSDTSFETSGSTSGVESDSLPKDPTEV